MVVMAGVMMIEGIHRPTPPCRSTRAVVVAEVVVVVVVVVVVETHTPRVCTRVNLMSIAHTYFLLTAWHSIAQHYTALCQHHTSQCFY
jgi:hypothetical protein